MATAQPLLVTLNRPDALRRVWNDVGLGLLVGIAGGLLQGSSPSLLPAEGHFARRGIWTYLRLGVLQTSIERWRRTDLGTKQRSPPLVSHTGRSISKFGTHDSNGMLDDARGRFSN